MATITSAYTQDPGSGGGYDLPWEPYVYKISDAAVLADLKVGQIITSITYLGGPATTPGIGGNIILSLVYNTGTSGTLYLENSAGRTLMGILIIDAAGTLLNPGNGQRGDITFKDLAVTADEKNKECFDKLVWDKQCTFAKDVLKFVNEISFGYFKPDTLECLKNEKRALEILNAYDTRDIEEETTNYNVFTYKQIKKLLK
tara:strand:+ start:3154 stop:3756 length:603 start_codon:yes stop_codon:yes gene_type:complete